MTLVGTYVDEGILPLLRTEAIRQPGGDSPPNGRSDCQCPEW
jgi:hypothetical protein